MKTKLALSTLAVALGMTAAASAVAKYPDKTITVYVAYSAEARQT